MRMRIAFVIEEGEAALKQVAACVGFANQLGIAITMEPIDDPKKLRVKWGVEMEIEDPDEKKLYAQANKVMEDGEAMLRKEFTQRLIKASKRTGQAIGKAVGRWLDRGILVEVD